MRRARQYPDPLWSNTKRSLWYTSVKTQYHRRTERAEKLSTVVDLHAPAPDVNDRHVQPEMRTVPREERLRTFVPSNNLDVRVDLAVQPSASLSTRTVTKSCTHASRQILTVDSELGSESGEAMTSPCRARCRRARRWRPRPHHRASGDRPHAGNGPVHFAREADVEKDTSR